MGIRAARPLANATPVNTGLTSRWFHMMKSETLYPSGYTMLYNPARRMAQAMRLDRFHRQWFPYSIDARRGKRLDDGRFNPFRAVRFPKRKHRRQANAKVRRRHALLNYKQALKWMSDEEWHERVMRHSRSSDHWQKGTCLPAEMIEHYHETGWYYRLNTWPLQWEALRRMREKQDYGRGEFRDVWGNREYSVELSPEDVSGAWYNQK